MAHSTAFLIKIALGLMVSCGVGAVAIAILAAHLSSPYLGTLFRTTLGVFAFGALTIFRLMEDVSWTD